MSMRTLLQERATLRDELAGLNTKFPDGALPEAEQRAFDATTEKLDGLENRVKRQAIVDEVDMRISGQPLAGADDKSWNGLLSRYSLSRAVLSCLPGHMGGVPKESGAEYEVSAELQRRTGRAPHSIWIPNEILERRATGGQVVGDSTMGGFIAPPSYRPDMFISPLYPASVIERLGATVITGVTESIDLPKQTGRTTAYWVNENEDVTESTAAFSMLKLSVRTVAGMGRFSRRMLQFSNPSIDAILRSTMEQQTATAIDVAALTGTGVKQPLGLLNYTTATTGIIPVLTQAGADGQDLALTDLFAMHNAPGLLNADIGGNGWLTNGNVIGALEALVDLTGRPYDLFETLPQSLMGDPVIRSQSVPNTLVKGNSGATLSAMIYGSWSSLIIAKFSPGQDWLVDPYTYSASQQIRVVNYQDVDFGVRYPEAFVIAKAIKTT
jgi:HK97 family phage major capsid protein